MARFTDRFVVYCRREWCFRYRYDGINNRILSAFLTLTALGGGGSTYSAYLDSLRVLEQFGPGKMRIIDPKSVPAGVEAVGHSNTTN